MYPRAPISIYLFCRLHNVFYQLLLKKFFVDFFRSSGRNSSQEFLTGNDLMEKIPYQFLEFVDLLSPEVSPTIYPKIIGKPSWTNSPWDTFGIWVRFPLKYPRIFVDVFLSYKVLSKFCGMFNIFWAEKFSQFSLILKFY